MCKGEIVCPVKSLLRNSIARAINLIFNLVTCELKNLKIVLCWYSVLPQYQA